MTRSLRNRFIAAAVLARLLSGCAQASSEETPPTEVAVTVVAAAPVQFSDDLPGRVAAIRTAEIRPQVGGIVQRTLFTEGAWVAAGQPLFQIAAGPFRADAAAAAAVLERARAIRDRARLQEARLRPLLENGAVSRQTYDDAAAELAQAQAEVSAAEAALARRRLDVGFATITAPIAGRIGASAVTVGALVGTTDARPMAIVHDTRRVHIDVRQPAGRLRAAQAAQVGEGAVTILDGGGTPTGQVGRLLFTEGVIDPATGAVRARVLVENSESRLLPGMFVRVRIPRGGQQTLLRVPQQAVSHAAGQASVVVVSAKGTAEARPVEIGEIVDDRYVILAGLKAGERVVVEGQDRIMPGQTVRARPWRDPAAAPAARVAVATPPGTSGA